MKISTKGIYAIEAMADLAMHSEDNVESIRNIAKRRKLSEKYLEQIIGCLRRAKLITSTRGAAGGYKLVRPAAEITMYDILAATEKDLIPLECIHKEPTCGMESSMCVTRKTWTSLWECMHEIMENVTLQDIIDQSKFIRNNKEIEYYI